MNPEVFKTYRTAMRCLAWTAAVAIAASALVAGTYINARWGGPTSITVSADALDDSPSPPPMFPKHEGEAERGHNI